MGIALEQLNTIARLWRNPARTREQVLAYQAHKLRALLRFAERHSEYYRAHFAAAGVRVSTIESADNLHLLPFTKKSELREVPRKQWATDVLGKATISVRTSGSSGQPFTIQRTRLENHVLGLFRLRANRWRGTRARDVTAIVAGVFPHQTPTWERRLRQALRIHRLVHVSCHQQPEEILEELEQIQPDILAGYPSVLGHLAHWAAVHQRPVPIPRRVHVSGETLLPAVRQRISEVFGAPVLADYAAHECNLIASECRETGYYHICDDAVAVEVLRDEEPVAEGERGEVVLTNLHSYQQPFIRYRIGDIARRGPTPCPCGAPFATLADIEGRWIDYYRLPDGRSIHHYEFVGSLIREAESWIWQYQMVQKTERLVVMRVVVVGDPEPEQIARFTHQMHERWGPELRFEIEVVDALPYTLGGKFRVAHSKLGSEYDDFQWPE